MFYFCYKIYICWWRPKNSLLSGWKWDHFGIFINALQMSFFPSLNDNQRRCSATSFVMLMLFQQFTGYWVWFQTLQWIQNQIKLFLRTESFCIVLVCFQSRILFNDLIPHVFAENETLYWHEPKTTTFFNTQWFQTSFILPQHLVFFFSLTSVGFDSMKQKHFKL